MASGRPVLVFDVLGTLVDQMGSLVEHVVAATGRSPAQALDVVDEWLNYVGNQERAVNAGQRPFVPSHDLDAEALSELKRRGHLSQQAASSLPAMAAVLRPWPDTVKGIDALAEHCVVMGLSNASRQVLATLAEGAGLRWQRALSAQDVLAYKPDPRIYDLAMRNDPTGQTPIMVAAHAWDLRAAASAGMRTAFVPRPNGDSPSPSDTFDYIAESLADLNEQLRA